MHLFIGIRLQSTCRFNGKDSRIRNCGKRKDEGNESLQNPCILIKL